MGTHFPDTQNFRDMLAPSRVEADIDNLEVIGDLPPELCGTYYRAGADPRFPPMLGDDEFIHGDGIIGRLRICNGKASYRSRYVRTERFLAEEKAGRSLFGRYRNPYTDDPSVAGINRGTANTNVISFAGRILALKEDTQPVELDPVTLETIGTWNAGGAITSPHITAHPRIDLKRNELLLYGAQAKGIGSPDVAYYVVDGTGKVVHETWFKAPYSSLLHDFVATDNWVVFPVFPAVTDLELVKRGEPYYHWDRHKKTYFGILPRRGTADQIRWFEGPPRFAIHFFNAYEKDGKIHIHACMGGGDEEGSIFPELNPPEKVEGNGHWANHLAVTTEWIIDTADDSTHVTEKQLRPGIFTDLPKIDQRYETTYHRYGYSMSKRMEWPSVGEDFIVVDCNAIEAYDFETGECSAWHTGTEASPQEPQFVPRSADAPLGDGWLLAMLNRNNARGSEFVLLDAQNVSAGPVARIQIPYHIRPAFHGNWVPDPA